MTTETCPRDVAFIAWERTSGGRWPGKWHQAAVGATEAEALSQALSRPSGLKHRDLIVLPADQGEP